MGINNSPLSGLNTNQTSKSQISRYVRSACRFMNLIRICFYLFFLVSNQTHQKIKTKKNPTCIRFTKIGFTTVPWQINGNWESISESTLGSMHFFENPNQELVSVQVEWICQFESDGRTNRKHESNWIGFKNWFMSVHLY